MPRAKPTETLVVRSVRLTSDQWLAFNALGGSDWLRSRIDKLRVAGIAKRQRNNRIRAAKRMGASDADLAAQFGVDRTTVWRVTR